MIQVSPGVDVCLAKASWTLAAAFSANDGELAVKA
jgi:hypothetical protein